MKNLVLCICILTSSLIVAQKAVKLDYLKIKYKAPEGWAADGFGGSTPWEDNGSSVCDCSGIIFTKQHKNGQMNVVVYPSTQSGLDSVKRQMAWDLKFQNVEKYDKTKNKFFSFEKRHSNFVDTKTNQKSFEVIKYFTKYENRYYIIYAWQESMDVLNPNVEKELYEMVNAIEPL